MDQNENRGEAAMFQASKVADVDVTLDWIDPIGGLGDALILSSVLHEVWTHTGRRFGMCRQLPYSEFFTGHPAIAQIAQPPKSVPRIKVDYWSYETPGPGRARPYQIYSRLFGLTTPREEVLWMPIGDEDSDPTLRLPVSSGSVIVAAHSVSPRKMWSPRNWAALVDGLRKLTTLDIVQIGMGHEPKIPGTISVRGLTKPREACRLIKRSALLVTVDAFPLHAAAWAGTPTVALWGPSDPDTFGYPWHTNVREKLPCDASCFPSRDYQLYLSPCAIQPGGCMAEVKVDDVLAAIEKVLAGDAPAES